MTQGKRRLVAEAGRANPVRPVHIWMPGGRPGGNLVVVSHLEVYATMHQHAVSSLPNETGGFLLGCVSFDAEGPTWLVEIEEAMPVEPGSQDPVHFSFDWRDVDRVRTYRQERNKALIGWYHTHPNLPIFLSETDLDRAHRVLFAEPFQLALVYDPVRGRAGYFYWEAPQTIDATQADWREFAIAVQEDELPTDPGAQADAAAAAEAPAAEAEPAGAGMTMIGKGWPAADEGHGAGPTEPSTPPMGTPAAAAANAMARAAFEGLAMVAAPPRAPASKPSRASSATAQVPAVAAPVEAPDEPRTLMMTAPHYAPAATPAATPLPVPPPVNVVVAPPSRRLMLVLLVIALVSLGFSAGIVAVFLLGKHPF